MPKFSNGIIAISGFQVHLKCVKFLQELAFKTYTDPQMLQSTISPMRYYDVCVISDHNLVLKLQLILNRKKWEMKKFCPTAVFLFLFLF